jgi:transposase
MERIAMSDQERRRAAVFHQVRAGKGTVREAARVLEVSYRQAKRLWARYRAGGARGLRHRSVGRPSNRGWPAATRAQILELVRTRYGGHAGAGPGQRFGPTLAAEHLWAEHGHRVPVPTLRRWMLAAGLWSRRRRAPAVHVRRARRAAFGALVQLDGSFHDWFEGRGPAPCLLSMIDDATGRTLSHFAEEETTWAALTLLRAWVERYGIPQAVYVDGKTVYVRAPTSRELLTGRAPLTQFGRVCQRLGIQVIQAHSPQAKGRIERNHGTGQDRLIKKLRLRAIAAIPAANAYLDTAYLPAHNVRFAVAPACALDAHTPVPPGLALDTVFVLESERHLRNDWVLRYQHQALQVTPTRAARRHTGPGQVVLVREGRAGALLLVAVDRETGREHPLAWTPLPAEAPAIPPPPRPSVVPAPVPPPAGYTRAGRPLSAAQIAQRARWAHQAAAEITQRETWRQLNARRRGVAES